MIPLDGRIPGFGFGVSGYSDGRDYGDGCGYDYGYGDGFIYSYIYGRPAPSLTSTTP